MAGKRHGRGMELAKNGEKYDGDWVDNQKHGVGTYRWPNGRWRDGVWTRDKRIKWLTEERIGGVKRQVQRRGAVKVKHKDLAAAQDMAHANARGAGDGRNNKSGGAAAGGAGGAGGNNRRRSVVG